MVYSAFSSIGETSPAWLFPPGQSVGPICLPEPGEQFEAGFICTTAGWGRLAEGEDFYAPLNQMLNFLVGSQKTEFLI